MIWFQAQLRQASTPRLAHTLWMQKHLFRRFSAHDCGLLCYDLSDGKWPCRITGGRTRIRPNRRGALAEEFGRATGEIRFMANRASGRWRPPANTTHVANSYYSEPDHVRTDVHPRL